MHAVERIVVYGALAALGAHAFGLFTPKPVEESKEPKIVDATFANVTARGLRVVDAKGQVLLEASAGAAGGALALADATGKPAVRAEATVGGGFVSVQSEAGKDL